MRARGSKPHVAHRAEAPEGRAPCGRVDRNRMSPIVQKLQKVAPHAGAWIETFEIQRTYNTYSVAPHAGAWIETILRLAISSVFPVAPHAGAWIETPFQPRSHPMPWSRPMRARGSKPKNQLALGLETRRAPCGRVDRNGQRTREYASLACRAPCGRVDRNVRSMVAMYFPSVSRPMRARGSKLHSRDIPDDLSRVAPHAGAWIETPP